MLPATKEPRYRPVVAKAPDGPMDLYCKVVDGGVEIPMSIRVEDGRVMELVSIQPCPTYQWRN